MFYDRNPGDARMKVGSERKAASRQTGANRRKPGVDEIGLSLSLYCAAGPSKIGLVIREFTPIKSPILQWDLVAQRALEAMVNVISAKRNGKRPSSTIVYFAQIQCFHCLFFRPWAPKTVPKPSRDCPITKSILFVV